MPSPQNTSNRLLRSLTSEDRNVLWPNLLRVSLPLRTQLELPNKTIKNAYFMESGFASVVANSHGHSIEVGLIGREGVTGLAILMGAGRTPNSTYIQLAGAALRIEAEALRAAMEESVALRQALLIYAHAFSVQTSQTALANGCVRVEERLARWLLMAHDRIDDNDVHLTHEFLSVMLGVRRAGVTIALNVLEARKLVRAQRGVIEILDRKGLEKLTNGTYGVVEREFQRLFG